MTDRTQSLGSSGRSDPLSRRVVDAVAAESDADPADLEPLYYSVDPDSLNSLFEGGGSTAGTNGCRVSFHYAGHQVTVTRGGSVVVDGNGVTRASHDSHPGGEPEAPD
ncbi:HalOD1 output domain-containing protein [Halobacterium wangiae]|uniref:HalOD1 output domain-containing protein n=1 Tax=Halobacterium wangiae TaxID=2902623 RepID=UPI001E2F4D29|nr:HalOD1 output domain-containing protein [Halobacterium wangiae]